MHTSCDALRNSEKHDSTSEKRTSEKAKTEATAQRRTSETRPPHRRRRSGRIYHMTLHHPSARAMRAILYHVPIGEYRARFFSNEPVACPCGETNLETRYHILTECLRYKDRVTLPTPCMTSSSHLIHRHSPSFLTGNLYKTFKSRQIQPHPPSEYETPREDPLDVRTPIPPIHTTKRLLVKDPACLSAVSFSFFLLLSICVF